MARLSDLPLVIRRVGLLTFARRVWREVNEDFLFTWGAALAYSWLFAIFPFLIFLLTLIPYLPQKVINEAYTRIPEVLYDWLPAQSAWTLWENIRRVLEEPPRGLLSLGLLVTIWAASGGINMTMTALDRCYELERGRSYFRRRLIAIAITVVVAILILAVLVLIPIGNVVTNYAIEHWPSGLPPVSRGILWTWNAARYLLAGVLMFTVVAIMYNQGIGVRQHWRIFSPGAVFTIGVWMLLAFAFRWYVNAFGKDSYNRTYGTVGGVAVLLLFFYLDALVLMIGAEINSEVDYEVLGVERGSRDFTLTPQPMFVEQSQPATARMKVEG
ncbi:MAG TPA: YihY/virulence factor BrkB family protein [Tepidisphaeraceae bacterium]|jgi:membrane protein